MNGGLFQQAGVQLLDPNGTTNGISNKVINESRLRASQGAPQVPPSPNGWMSPEELRAQSGRLQSFGQQPQAANVPPGGDMQTMDPNAMPQAGAEMPMLNGASSQDNLPTYVGNPVLDKYIHAFIGGA